MGKIKLAKGFRGEKRGKEYSGLTKRSLLNRNRMVLLKRNGKVISLVLEIALHEKLDLHQIYSVQISYNKVQTEVK